MKTDKARENRYRRMAKRSGYVLKKSRAWNWSYNNQLGYTIIDAQHNCVVWGSNMELDLDDVAYFFEDPEEEA